MRTDLRSTIDRHSGYPDHYPDHIGLAYDVWAPTTLEKGKDCGKVPSTKKEGWLKQLATTKISSDYGKSYYPRWWSALAKIDAAATEVTLAARLLVGHGNAAPSEVGLTVHHTWGVPMIPGTALKGLLAHYLATIYGPESAVNQADVRDLHNHPMYPHGSEEDSRSQFQGVTWDDKRIIHGPGTIHRWLFGAPAAETDDLLREMNVDAGETQGGVRFHDALYVPSPEGEKDAPFAPDVVTVHQSSYYRSGGADCPNDYEAPIPVSFLSVRPKTKFLLAVSGPSSEWNRFAIDLLCEALEAWGIGGKTSSGYGHIATTEPGGQGTRSLVDWAKWMDGCNRKLAFQSALYKQIQEQLDAWKGEMTQAVQITALLSHEWMPKIKASSPAIRQAIAKLVKYRFSKRLDKEDTKILLQTIAENQEDVC